MTAPVRFSTLKAMAKSPAHYRALLASPRTDSAAMRMGRAIHSLVLGGPKVVVYSGVRRGKAWDEFEAEHLECEILNPEEWRTAQDASEAVLSNPLAQPYLDGILEERLRWQVNGIDCAGTPDVAGADCVTDLKTTQDASPLAFGKTAARFHHHAQLSWYMNALAILGRPVSRAAIIAVESAPPHSVVVYELDALALDEGRRLWLSWMARLEECIATGEWPGYVNTVQPLTLPEWALSELALEF